MAYEAKLDYIESAPGDTYGETVTTYSLERAVILIPASPWKYALIVSSDYAAVNPICTYAGALLGLTLYPPNLTETMMSNVVGAAVPRVTSFRRRSGADDNQASVITVSDARLGESQDYLELAADPSREKTYGFFRGYPSLQRGGLGIARRYGRIWTPARLSNSEIRRLGLGILRAVDRELAVTRNERIPEFVEFHHNMPVRIGDRLLNGGPRRAFDTIMRAVLGGQQGEYELELSELHEIIANAGSLQMLLELRVECPECADVIVLRCDQCGSPLVPRIRAGGVVAACPTHGAVDIDRVTCECGTVIEVPLLQSIFGFALPPLLDAFQSALTRMGEVFRNAIYLNGTSLESMARSTPAIPTLVRLEDCQKWRVNAHLHELGAALTQKTIVGVMRGAREKCTNAGPSCDACLARTPLPAEIRSGHICLLRIFGLPIGEGFDGRHHGAEMADLQYSDQLAGAEIHVGIHVKSYDPQKRRPLGKGSKRIQELYAQYAFSLYKVHKGDWEFDVLGISVPQRISIQVLESFQFIADSIGIPLLVMQDDEWARVIQAALETAQFANP